MPLYDAPESSGRDANINMPATMPSPKSHLDFTNTFLDMDVDSGVRSAGDLFLMSGDMDCGSWASFQDSHLCCTQPSQNVDTGMDLCEG